MPSTVNAYLSDILSISVPPNPYEWHLFWYNITMTIIIGPLGSQIAFWILYKKLNRNYNWVFIVSSFCKNGEFVFATYENTIYQNIEVELEG